MGREPEITMRPIRELPPSVVNKIAAGEVIERPASVVKELLENALDARARSITVEVVDGGRDLVRVTDDGYGIPADELPLAVRSHATSKLTSPDDLYCVETFGFRGEALASIAAVSELRLQSRPANQPNGAVLEVRFGVGEAVAMCGCSPGTQVEVRNLFANLPVRRKFLKSKATELGQITESVTRIALARPGLQLRVFHNDKLVLERPADLDRRETIALWFHQELANRGLYEIQSAHDAVRISGMIADPHFDRPDSRWQYLFVNGRFVRDRSLNHAITEAYRGLVMTGRYPVAFIFIDIEPKQVDVNVHPMKLEVRFQDPHRVYSQLLSVIRTRLLSLDLTARLSLRGASPASTVQGSSVTRDAINREFELRGGTVPRPQPTLWSDPLPAPNRANGPEPQTPRPPADFTPVADSPVPLEAHVQSRPPTSFPAGQAEPARTSSEGASDVVDTALGFTTGSPLDETAGRVFSAPAHRAIQLHNAFLIVETQDGMLVIDQHALHERIVYERLRTRVAQQAVEVQELLIPEPVELLPQQVGLILEQRDLLSKIGLRIEDFGERCVLVQSFPCLLRRLSPESLMREIASHLETTGKLPSREQLLDDLLHLLACKAAVKAGDPLTQGEIDELLEQCPTVENSHHCPHGRPTALRFTIQELERQFKRM
jgi:DNA mismatch repair protein MutL